MSPIGVARVGAEITVSGSSVEKAMHNAQEWAESHGFHASDVQRVELDRVLYSAEHPTGHPVSWTATIEGELA